MEGFQILLLFGIIYIWIITIYFYLINQTNYNVIFILIS